MDNSEVKEFVRKVLIGIGISENVIKDEVYLRSEIGLDSTEVVDLALAVKKEYNVDLSLKNDITLNTLYSTVLENIKNSER